MRRGLGVALAADALVADRASEAGSRDSWSRTLTPLASGPGWSDLAPALEELRHTVSPKAGTVHVALLPPLVQARWIELPRLTEDELRVVLARDAGRYLLDPPAVPLVAAWSRLPGRGSPVRYLAAFADEDLVASVHAATSQAGFRATRVLPAHVAWEAGTRRYAPVVLQGTGRLLVAGEHLVEALEFEGGWIRRCRRAAHADAAAVVGPEPEGPELLGGSAHWVGVVASDAMRHQIESALHERGLSPERAFGEPRPFANAAALAAAGAPLARAGELLPRPLRLDRWRRERRLSHRLLAGAAAMLLLSAGLELWGAHRELASLQAERGALRPLVTRAMELRQTVDGVHERLRALAAAEAGASRWTGVIADVADRLPPDAHLLSLRGEGDSLVLEGVASRAAGAFESLRGAPSVAGVRAEAPIRQEAQDSAAPVERFTLGARLAALRPARDER